MRKCSCPSGKHQQLMVDTDGKKSGNVQLLKSSQSYPDDLGVALVNAWQTAGVFVTAIQVGNQWEGGEERRTRGRTGRSAVGSREEENPWQDVLNENLRQDVSTDVCKDEAQERQDVPVEDNPWQDITRDANKDEVGLDTPWQDVSGDASTDKVGQDNPWQDVDADKDESPWGGVDLNRWL